MLPSNRLFYPCDAWEWVTGPATYDGSFHVSFPLTTITSQRSVSTGPSVFFGGGIWPILLWPGSGPSSSDPREPRLWIAVSCRGGGGRRGKTERCTSLWPYNEANMIRRTHSDCSLVRPRPLKRRWETHIQRSTNVTKPDGTTPQVIRDAIFFSGAKRNKCNNFWLETSWGCVYASAILVSLSSKAI